MNRVEYPSKEAAFEALRSVLLTGALRYPHVEIGLLGLVVFADEGLGSDDGDFHCWKHPYHTEVVDNGFVSYDDFIKVIDNPSAMVFDYPTERILGHYLIDENQKLQFYKMRLATLKKFTFRREDLIRFRKKCLDEKSSVMLAVDSELESKLEEWRVYRNQESLASFRDSLLHDE